MSDEELLKLAENYITKATDGHPKRNVLATSQASIACSLLVLARNSAPEIVERRVDVPYPVSVPEPSVENGL